MKKLTLTGILTLAISCPAFATGIDAGAQSADCDNDVLATEAVWNDRHADFTARKILADIAGMTVNDTTNTLTTRIIFGSNRHPQDQFNYRFMGTEEDGENTNYTVFTKDHKPLFPGYSFDRGKSIYRGELVGEGGYVYAEPGMYRWVALLDVASMHPTSIVTENLFGPEYTKRFDELLQARIAIKHRDFESARKMLNGVLAGYLDNEDQADDLAQALKIAINSVYGLTSASFENAFRDIRNIDNIVAKRGALFMINLKHEVQKKGYTVAHIKTDSIKIPNATNEIIKFVMDYGKKYGYSFEHEATYDRMTIVNDAVYIAKYASAEACDKRYHYIPKDNGKHPGEWTATGTQFAVPYVFKTLFSHEPITFEDKCETKSVTSSLYLDMNEGYPDVTNAEKDYSKLETKYRKGEISDTTFESEGKVLTSEIDTGHNYIFVGRVGNFCPIKEGCGGGLLCREQNGKYYSATGAKGYRWLESEMVKSLGKEDCIDDSYYVNLVDEAAEAIAQYSDLHAFCEADEKEDWDFMNIPDSAPEEMPWD